MLKANNLLKSYIQPDSSKSLRVLDNPNLEIKQGEFVSIMGASGTGKTTLLNALSGLDRNIDGEVWVNEINISNLSMDELSTFRRNKIGFVFQEFHLLEGLTMFDNIALAVSLVENDPKVIERTVKLLMIELNIKEIAKKYPWQTSRGQQQRVAIARAIVNQPKLIFADEPTGNLDYESSQIVMSQLKSINQSNNTTIVMVTHDHEIASHSNRIINLSGGRILSDSKKGASS